MASVTNYKGHPEELLNAHYSGLLNYLFGTDRKNEINKEKMKEFQQQLMDDVLWLEFTRYSKDGETISEADFCSHLLLCADITSKKKKKMVKYPVIYSPRKYIKTLIKIPISVSYHIFILYFAISQISKVKKEGYVGKGITFEGFKCFYNVLFGGADLERAMFFLDTEKNGVNRY